MQKTKIEWADYVWNPIKGLCPTGCWYCYARSFYKRFKWNPEIRFDLKEMDLIDLPSKPSRIFVGSTIDLFHPSFTITDTSLIIRAIRMRRGADKHIWMFLTKNPERYAKFYFPKNCWLGTTVTCADDLSNVYKLSLANESKQNLLFVSIEPLLSDVGSCVTADFWQQVNWVIIGRMTGVYAKKYQPAQHWIERLVHQNQKINTPIFLKDNLKKIWPGELIQQFPGREER